MTILPPITIETANRERLEAFASQPHIPGNPFVETCLLDGAAGEIETLWRAYVSVRKPGGVRVDVAAGPNSGELGLEEACAHIIERLIEAGVEVP